MTAASNYTQRSVFTPEVRSFQERRGSRAHYAKVEEGGGFRTTITPELAAFVAERDSFYLATANAEGQPYIQHRGGPPGFIRVLDEKTLAFVDFRGNRQYITSGNLAVNDRAFIFLMDYSHKRRIKLWGRAKIVDDDPELIAKLFPVGYRARAEQAIVFTIDAWDPNCSQHIPHLVPADEMQATVAGLRRRIQELEDELARAKTAA
jgi:predicted pyridoxine 5'-phosphate oxidase superfamily flavin-nucleotide-binding protein